MPNWTAGSVLTDLWQDVRYAIRKSCKQPGPTAVFVATLAVCFAANIAIFAVVDGVVLRPLPFPEAHRLVAIHNSYPGAGVDVAPNSAAQFYERRELAALASLATYRRVELTLGGGGGGAGAGGGNPERVAGLVASPSLFPLLGTTAWRGRLLLDEDAEPGANRQVVLTHGYWTRAFGGRDSVIGDTLRVDGTPFTVIGVLPAGWRFIDPDLEIVLPAVFTANDRTPAMRHRNNSWRQVGRLAPGATLETLQAQIAAQNAAHLDQVPEMRQPLANIGFATRALAFQEFVAGRTASTLYFLWGGVVVVLLIAGVNLTNMVLVDATARRREWATRVALGAGAGRLLRQSLIESSLLTATGAIAGVLLGIWALTLAPSFGLDDLPRGTEIAIDARVFVYLVAIASIVSVALGLLPLAAHGRTSLARVIGEAGRTGTASRAGRIARRVLAAAQVACALMLLVAGAALLAGLQRALTVDLGFRSERLLTAQLSFSAPRYASRPELQSLLDRLLERVRQLPGVEAAGIASTTPFGGMKTENVILAEGYRMAPNESVISVRHVSVSDGYFDTIGARLVAGRWFDQGDAAGRGQVIIIDDRIARKFFPDGNAIGRRMWGMRATARPLDPPPEAEMLTVVGVVAEMRLSDVVDDPGVRSHGAVYYPFRQRSARGAGLAIRTASEPTAIAAAVRRVLAGLDPEMPLYDADTVDRLIDRSLVDRRTPAVLAAGFALVALFLAMLGVYGVLAYQVSRRTRELGIRMALGADRRRIFGLVLGEGVVIAAAGTLTGLAGAALLRRTIHAQIYGIGMMDAPTLIAVVALVGVIALVATAIPARRAARTDPAVALTDV